MGNLKFRKYRVEKTLIAPGLLEGVFSLLEQSLYGGT